MDSPVGTLNYGTADSGTLVKRKTERSVDERSVIELCGSNSRIHIRSPAASDG
jgi:hypothetical protein